MHVAGFEGFFVVGDVAEFVEFVGVVGVLAYFFDTWSGVASVVTSTGWMRGEIFGLERKSEELLGLEGLSVVVGWV